jgi:hypothetical protein
MHRHFCLIVGRWKLENWRLYRLTEHHSAKKASNRWVMWDRIL